MKDRLDHFDAIEKVQKKAWADIPSMMRILRESGHLEEFRHMVVVPRSSLKEARQAIRRICPERRDYRFNDVMTCFKDATAAVAFRLAVKEGVYVDLMALEG